MAEKIWPTLTFNKVCDIAHLPSQHSILLIQQMGKIWILPDDIKASLPQAKLFADLKNSLPEFESSFSMAFHPDFETNHEVFVFYRTAKNQIEDATHISRFKTYRDRLELDPASEEIIITFRSGGHNGGHLGFGPDKMLYILAGDSEAPSPPDPLNTGQDISDLLSSVLRIDVDRRDPGKNYHIPDDNPFRKITGARPEIWAYGFRNPWKLSFHPQSGDLWVGDVGWDLWEMLDRVERGSNFGWSITEGPQLIKPNQNPGPSPVSPPTIIHPHTEMSSITGGYVSDTDRLPGLKGVYLYGDFGTGQVWGLWLDDGGKKIRKDEFLADTRMQIVSFGQAANGEVIFVDWPTGQNIYRLVPNRHKDASSNFPKLLSETGIFSNVPKQTPQPGVYKFSINGPMWRGGATAQRWIGIPGKGSLKSGATGSIPAGTVLIKTLSQSNQKIETQLLHYDGTAWQGYSYEWNEAQNDAALVASSGKTRLVQGRKWNFYSRAQCMRCHNVGSDYRLAFQPGQLNQKDQLSRLNKLGLVDEQFIQKAVEQASANLNDDAAPINLRARTWLSANCAHCHQPRGGGSVAINMNLKVGLDQMGIVNAPPLKGDFGIDGAKLIVPGDPFRSVLFYRAITTGTGHMPLLGEETVDPLGERLLHDWIQSLGEAPLQAPRSGVADALRKKHRILTGEIVGKRKDQIISEVEKSGNIMIQGLFQEWAR